MVSYVYTEMEKLNPQTVLHERETSSSGRPKAQSLQQEDANFVYQYDSRGGLISKTEKTPLGKYEYWYKHNVKFSKNHCRQTPLTAFESAMGIRACIPTYRYKHCSCGERCGCATSTYNEDEWEKFMQTHSIDYGELEIWYSADTPAHVGQGNYDFEGYFKKKANEQNLEVVSIQGLAFREKQKPAVVEKVRPNPKEESIASVKIEEPEPVEVEPIKEAAKYSPLMIAGVIAVIVLILWRRA